MMFLKLLPVTSHNYITDSASNVDNMQQILVAVALNQQKSARPGCRPRLSAGRKVENAGAVTSGATKLATVVGISI